MSTAYLEEPRTSEVLSTTVEGPVGVLWLNRPDKRNAVNLDMWAALPEHLERLRNDDSVRVVVIRGVGDHFCAGADISTIGVQLTDGDGPGSYRSINKVAEETIATFEKPTIAMIKGFCVGGGCQISLSCDMRIVDDSAQLGITVSKLGFSYPSFALERCARLIGTTNTKHLLYSAEIVDAQTALRWGMVNEVHAPNRLTERVHTFATAMAERSMLTIRATKEALYELEHTGSISDGLTAKWELEARTSPDITEGVASFTEKRQAAFSWMKTDF